MSESRLPGNVSFLRKNLQKCEILKKYLAKHFLQNFLLIVAN